MWSFFIDFFLLWNFLRLYLGKMFSIAFFMWNLFFPYYFLPPFFIFYYFFNSKNIKTRPKQKAKKKDSPLVFFYTQGKLSSLTAHQQTSKQTHSRNFLHLKKNYTRFHNTQIAHNTTYPYLSSRHPFKKEPFFLLSYCPPFFITRIFYSYIHTPYTKVKQQQLSTFKQIKK